MKLCLYPPIEGNQVMKDLNTLDHFKLSEDLVEVLMHKTQSPEPLFFRILVAYYFTKVASMMHCNIKTHDRGIIPVNMYAINLSPSGTGKGHSTNIMEEEVINQFRDEFLNSTIEVRANMNLDKLALERSIKRNSNRDVEEIAVKKEYDKLGAMPFSFDGGTSPAVKQVRHKVLMADAGSLNFEMDEIGSNLLGNVEVLTTYLELFDVGKVKPKLTKNTSDNVRNEDINGRTPTNMMLFGTGTKLLDGDKVEQEFDDMLGTGYARRCFFGYTTETNRVNTLTPGEIYDMLTSSKDSTFLSNLSNQLHSLADMVNFDKELTMTRDISVLLIEYKMYCEDKALTLGLHEETRKAELSHRYFKALKLAGTFAFIEQNHEITETILYNAIKLVEESGEAFAKVLTRERNYVKLAKYIASIGREVTHVDLVEDLPCYKGTAQIKQEMMSLATAYGYKNNIIIKKSFIDGIEFLSGESLKEVDTKSMTISYSQQMSDNYINEQVNFDDIQKLTQATGFHWINHYVMNGDRREKSIIPGFNLLVLDVDGGTPLDTVKLLFKGLKFHAYATKSNTDADNRFRLILPMNYELKLSKEEYTQFMENIYEWLPFDVDTSTKDRCRKWLANKASWFTNDGELFDVLPFIPKTQKNEERKKIYTDQQSLNNLQRWFINNTGEGNRSNQMIKYALLLVDSGHTYEIIHSMVRDFNDRLPNKLSDDELLSTIMQSTMKAISAREGA